MGGISNNNCSIQVSNVCEMIPVVSSLNSIVELALKIIIQIMRCVSCPPTSDYLLHVANKSFARIHCLFVPIIGQVIVLLYDCIVKEMNECHQIEEEERRYMQQMQDIALAQAQAQAEAEAQVPAPAPAQVPAPAPAPAPFAAPVPFAAAGAQSEFDIALVQVAARLAERRVAETESRRAIAAGFLPAGGEIEVGGGDPPPDTSLEGGPPIEDSPVNSGSEEDSDDGAYVALGSVIIEAID